MRNDKAGCLHCSRNVGGLKAKRDLPAMNGPKRRREHPEVLCGVPSGQRSEGIPTTRDDRRGIHLHVLGCAERLSRDVVEQPQLHLCVPIVRPIDGELVIELREDVSEVVGQGGRDEHIDLIVHRFDGGVGRDEEATNTSGNQGVKRHIVGWPLKGLVRTQVVQIVSNYGDSTIRQVNIAAPVSVTAMVKWPP